jgi:hypothetical protein
MRWSAKLLIVALIGLAALELVIGGSSQAQFNFGGGKGKGGGNLFDNPVALLSNGAVKKELKLTDDQGPKVNDAIWKALADVLNEDQLKRLRQIDLQVREAAAFADPKVQTQLKLTDDQKDDIKTILADAEKAMGEAMKGAFGKGAGGPGGVNPLESLQAMRREQKDKCIAVLTTPQKRQWAEMIGEEFKLDMGGFGGGAFGDPNKTKKKKGGDDD